MATIAPGRDGRAALEGRSQGGAERRTAHGHEPDEQEQRDEASVDEAEPADRVRQHEERRRQHGERGQERPAVRARAVSRAASGAACCARSAMSAALAVPAPNGCRSERAVATTARTMTAQTNSPTAASTPVRVMSVGVMRRLSLSQHALKVGAKAACGSATEPAGSTPTRSRHAAHAASPTRRKQRPQAHNAPPAISRGQRRDPRQAEEDHERMPVSEQDARRETRGRHLPSPGARRPVVRGDHQLEPHRQGDDEDGDAEQVAREAEQRHEPEAERQPEVGGRHGPIAVQPPSRPEQRERASRSTGNVAIARIAPSGPERDDEHIAQVPKERIGAQVGGEDEEALLEGRSVEPVPHRDETRVCREVLKREGVEEPEDEDRRESQRGERQPSVPRPAPPGGPARARRTRAGFAWVEKEPASPF